jgi:hypothetical protein
LNSSSKTGCKCFAPTRSHLTKNRFLPQSLFDSLDRKMQDVETLHREAMELVDQTVLARQRGDAEAVAALAQAAFTKERAAAD